MSDRLKQLRDLIEAAPGKPAEYARWHALLEAEIAERDAPPPVLEGALAEVVQQLNLATGLVRMLRPDARERFRGVVEAVEAARTRLEALALRGARPATRAEWLAVALDLAQDEGEVTEGLARAVASLLPRLVEHESVRGALVKRVVGPWSFVRTEDPYEDWRRHPADGDYVADAAESDGQEDGQEGVFWRVWDRNRLVTHGHAPTIREAMLAADAALRAKGRILLGGLPDEVALEVTPPEEAQPDASWLRHVRPADGNVRLGWVYEGGTLLQLAQFLIGDPEYFQGEGLPRVRLVTRAPLDGDWCASCGANIDGERFLTSRIRIVAGEEARVCGDCAEDSDGGWP